MIEIGQFFENTKLYKEIIIFNENDYLYMMQNES